MTLENQSALREIQTEALERALSALPIDPDRTERYLEVFEMALDLSSKGAKQPSVFDDIFTAACDKWESEQVPQEEPAAEAEKPTGLYQKAPVTSHFAQEPTIEPVEVPAPVAEKPKRAKKTPIPGNVVPLEEPAVEVAKPATSEVATPTLKELSALEPAEVRETMKSWYMSRVAELVKNDPDGAEADKPSNVFRQRVRGDIATYKEGSNRFADVPDKELLKFWGGILKFSSSL